MVVRVTIALVQREHGNVLLVNSHHVTLFRPAWLVEISHCTAVRGLRETLCKAASEAVNGLFDGYTHAILHHGPCGRINQSPICGLISCCIAG